MTQLIFYNLYLLLNCLDSFINVLNRLIMLSDQAGDQHFGGQTVYCLIIYGRISQLLDHPLMPQELKSGGYTVTADSSIQESDQFIHDMAA